MIYHISKSINNCYKGTQCTKLLPLRGQGRVRCMQPYSCKHRGCFRAHDLEVIKNLTNAPRTTSVNNCYVLTNDVCKDSYHFKLKQGNQSAFLLFKFLASRIRSFGMKLLLFFPKFIMDSQTLHKRNCISSWYWLFFSADSILFP